MITLKLIFGPFIALNCSFHVALQPISLSSTSIHSTILQVSHLTSQPTLITSPPPKGSYFLIARPSCSGIPEINSPPLCYSYYLGVLELAWPSKQTLYSVFFFSHPIPRPLPPQRTPLTTLSVVIHYSRAWDAAAGCRGE